VGGFGWQVGRTGLDRRTEPLHLTVEISTICLRSASVSLGRPRLQQLFGVPDRRCVYSPDGRDLSLKDVCAEQSQAAPATGLRCEFAILRWG
jgi:hypothetical protein